jgi:hypothetical protein
MANTANTVVGTAKVDASPPAAAVELPAGGAAQVALAVAV